MLKDEVKSQGDSVVNGAVGLVRELERVQLVTDDGLEVLED